MNEETPTFSVILFVYLLFLLLVYLRLPVLLVLLEQEVVTCQS